MGGVGGNSFRGVMRPETLLEILSSLVTHCSCGLTLGLQPLDQAVRRSRCGWNSRGRHEGDSDVELKLNRVG